MHSRDGETFAALVRRHGPIVLGVCKRVLGDDHAAEDACQAVFLALSRQARTIQNKEMERVVRMWFVTDDGPIDAALLAQHPELIVVRSDPATWARFDVGTERIVLLDPLQNRVLAFPRDPDIKAMAKDISRLLKASRIG